VELEDNYTFDSENLKYRLMTPNIPARVLSLNMGTKKPSQLFMEHYQNHSHPESIQCEKISVTMRDGYQVPLVMAYDKRHFNEKSPWVIVTKGADSNKADIQFEHSKISMMNRGICLCYPLVRGTFLKLPD
jgi:oligopeptidase B